MIQEFLMGEVISKDGTAIAFDKSGEGSPLILVSGAFTVRLQPTLVQLAALLAPHFTVFNYDRRGRGDSGETPPYAVEYFMTRAAEAPAEWVAQMHNTPMWEALEAVAHTLIYDVTIMGCNNALPTERVASVTVPRLVIDGGASPAWMHHAAQAVADTLPNAQRRTLPGQTHGVAAEAIAPVLEEFFAD
jgi:pimeloyl-ACP methyl ester carboxylesterase